LSPESEEALRDCFESTDWRVLQQSHVEDIEGVTHCITNYMNFCRDTVLHINTLRCFPNNKPWITSDIKDVLKDGDRDGLKQTQK